jgi:hypothetical protein
MKTLSPQMKFVLGALALLLVLEIVPTFVAPPFADWQEKKEADTEMAIPQLSDFDGEASIGGPAVMVSQEEGVIENILLCSGLPESAFMLLFALYIVLLFFNLRGSYQEKGYTGGIFEIVLTAAFLGLWGYFDECHVATWFPLLTIKTGLILYILVALLFPYIQAQKKPQDATLF